MKKLSALLLACAVMLSGFALADYEFDASVVCVQPEYVTASIGGAVGDVPAMVGQLVSSGEVLASLTTAKIYAPVSGSVTGIFCDAGDSVSTITERYGALLSIEPDSKYTLTASTDYAYNASANKYIHVGEIVYLLSSDGAYSGTGFVTAVSGTDFTVEATSGSFYIGNTVYVYRDVSHASSTRIGRGEIARAENVAISGTQEGGSIAALRVTKGQHVKAGDLLLETLSGEYDASYCTGSDLMSDADGILASLNVSVGASVNKGDVIATLYPLESLQLKAEINEADLAALAVGTEVAISFNWNEDSEDADDLTGIVTQVLYTAVETSGGEGASESGSASYAAYIDFEADESTRLGMTAVLRPLNRETGAPDADVEDFDAPDADAEDFDAPDSDA